MPEPRTHRLNLSFTKAELDALRTLWRETVADNKVDKFTTWCRLYLLTILED